MGVRHVKLNATTIPRKSVPEVANIPAPASSGRAVAPVVATPADSIPMAVSEQINRATNRPGRGPRTVRRIGEYRQLVIDCDGVLFDSNPIKAANILEAARGVCDSATAERFVQYFVANNGVPRESKIRHFFQDEAMAGRILARYNRLNATTIPHLQPIPSARTFVGAAAGMGIPLYLVSGGEEHEVRALLQNCDLADSFAQIAGGPDTKEEHLQRLALAGSTCFFGDSLHDYDVARAFGFDFVFLHSYTQFDEWESFFSDKPDVMTIPDFSAIQHWFPCFE